MPMQCPYMKGYSCSMMPFYPMLPNYYHPKKFHKKTPCCSQYNNPTYYYPYHKKHKHYRDEHDHYFEHDNYLPYYFDPPMFYNPMYSTHSTNSWSTYGKY